MLDLENQMDIHNNELVASRDKAFNIQEKRNSNHNVFDRLMNRRKHGGGIYTVDEYTDGLKKRRSIMKTGDG